MVGYLAVPLTSTHKMPEPLLYPFNGDNRKYPNIAKGPWLQVKEMDLLKTKSGPGQRGPDTVEQLLPAFSQQEEARVGKRRLARSFLAPQWRFVLPLWGLRLASSDKQTFG